MPSNKITKINALNMILGQPELHKQWLLKVLQSDDSMTGLGKTYGKNGVGNLVLCIVEQSSGMYN